MSETPEATARDRVATLTTLIHHHLYIQAALYRIGHELNLRAIVHDGSKLRPDEAEGFARINATARTFAYGSQEYMDALAKERGTLDLHFGRNPHHPEYHAQPSLEMGLFDLIEMACDWYAAWSVYEISRPQSKKTSLDESLAVQRDRFSDLTEAQWFVIDETLAWLRKG